MLLDVMDFVKNNKRIYKMYKDNDYVVFNCPSGLVLVSDLVIGLTFKHPVKFLKSIRQGHSQDFKNTCPKQQFQSFRPSWFC